MILQQLARDYERILSFGSAAVSEDEAGPEPRNRVLPTMYDFAPVHWEIRLDEGGRFMSMERLSGSAKYPDSGQVMAVPSAVRTVGIRPLLLADTAAYTLGLDLDDSHAAIKHRAFFALLQDCAEETRLPAIDAVVRFLCRELESVTRLAAAKGVRKSDRITFRVGNSLPIHDPAVQAFWARRCETKARRSAPMQCLVCGERRPAVENMPFMIKGMPSGQASGTALVSFNIEVFESYGLKRAANSPICSECAEKFSKALKALMRSPKTRQYVGSMACAFWTDSVVQDLLNPEWRRKTEQIRDLICPREEGRWRDLDAKPYYALMLSANRSRVVVRGWIATTIGQVRRSLARWFLWQRIEDPYGAEGEPLTLSMLAASLCRQSADDRMCVDEIDTRIAQALVHSALHGDPLPLDLLHRAVLRNRAENSITYERAALITAVLRSRHEIAETAAPHLKGVSALETSGSLDTNAQRAETCGKLLAILEELQRQFARADNRRINHTLVDRFFGTASTSPATVFGTLLADAQAHLTRLRKVRPGTCDAIQRELETTLLSLDAFPRCLSMKQQALFSLGYYHQRATQRRGIVDRAMRKAGQDEAAEYTNDADAPDVETPV